MYNSAFTCPGAKAILDTHRSSSAKSSNADVCPLRGPSKEIRKEGITPGPLTPPLLSVAAQEQALPSAGGVFDSPSAC